jgi:hypothetical protein
MNLGAQLTVQTACFPPSACETANAVTPTVTMARMASRIPAIAICELPNRRAVGYLAGAAAG